MGYRASHSKRVLRAVVAAAAVGGVLLTVPSLGAASTTGGASTWTETQQYAGSGGVVSCPPGLVSGVPRVNAGGACFGLDHPYTNVASITVADAAAPNVDGVWQIDDVNQTVLSQGLICSGAAESMPAAIPANATTLWVFVGDPTTLVSNSITGVGCGAAGTPTATSGTVTATFTIPSGSMVAPVFPVNCPGGIQSGRAMRFLTGASSSLQPPPVTLPCGTPGLPPAGQPSPVNMAYFGGHVQVNPRSYLVLWGWNAPNAFRDPTTGGNPANDPDGAGARMQAFLAAIGGSRWAGVQTQYYETGSGGNTFITNPTNQLAGVWADDTNPIHDNLSQLDIAQEAQRAAVHFGVLNTDGTVANPDALSNANFIVAQPQDYNDAGFSAGLGYCAWHDNTEPAPYPYPGVTPGISFTSMPYVVNLGPSCGAGTVNSGPPGAIDGVSIVLGHEEEETVTDPGAEETVNGQTIGGWYDYNSYENGDKCAWVGDFPVGVTPVPGAIGTMTGSDNKLYPVQSLWSNNAAGGAGYCAGTNNDLPF